MTRTGIATLCVGVVDGKPTRADVLLALPPGARLAGRLRVNGRGVYVDVLADDVDAAQVALASRGWGVSRATTTRGPR